MLAAVEEVAGCLLYTRRFPGKACSGRLPSRGITPCLDFASLRYPTQTTVTWVMERHQDIVDGLHGAAPALLHNVAGLDFRSVDLLAHAARGVQDEAQAGGGGDVQQPGESHHEGCAHLFQPLVSQLPEEHLGSPSEGHSPGETPVPQAASQEAEGLDGGQEGQFCSLEVERVVWGEGWRQAVLVDASPWRLGAALVKTAPMATFSWVRERDLEGGSKKTHCLLRKWGPF